MHNYSPHPPPHPYPVSLTMHICIIAPAAAAKSLQSCPTLCNPIDSSPPGSLILGILKARTLEWVAISFSKAWKWKVKVKSLSPVWLFVTPWTAAYQAPPSIGFSRQEYWSGVPSSSLIIAPTVAYSIYALTCLTWHLDLSSAKCIFIKFLVVLEGSCTQSTSVQVLWMENHCNFFFFLTVENLENWWYNQTGYCLINVFYRRVFFNQYSRFCCLILLKILRARIIYRKSLLWLLVIHLERIYWTLPINELISVSWITIIFISQEVNKFLHIN